MKKLSLLALSTVFTSIIISTASHAQYLEVRNTGEGAVQAGTLITTGIGLSKGKVWIWGFRGSGQQGNNVHSVNHAGNRIPAAPVNNLPPMVAVTGGAYHILAIDHQGYVYGWGQNLHGEAGCDGTKQKNYRLTPCKLKDSTGRYLQGVSQVVSAGEYHTVYLDKNGDVYTSGLHTLGRLGHGDTIEGRKDARLPKKVNLKGEHARLIGAQYEGSIAITHEGNVWVWGDNEYMGLAIDYNKNKDTRWIWTPTIAHNLQPYAHDIVAIGGGQLWGAALLKDGRMLGWGGYSIVGLKCPADGNKYKNHSSSLYSPIPQVIPIPDKIVSAVMRYDGTIALSEHGEIYTFGTNHVGEYAHFQGHCVKKAPLPESFIKEHGKVVRVGTGKHNVTYEMEDGTTWGTGLNDYGMLSSDTPRNRIYDWPGVQIKQITD